MFCVFNLSGYIISNVSMNDAMANPVWNDIAVEIHVYFVASKYFTARSRFIWTSLFFLIFMCSISFLGQNNLYIAVYCSSAIWI